MNEAWLVVGVEWKRCGTRCVGGWVWSIVVGRFVCEEESFELLISYTSTLELVLYVTGDPSSRSEARLLAQVLYVPTKQGNMQTKSN